MVYKTVAATLLGALFIAAGANHFVHPAFYQRIVPPSFPSPALLVVISGIAEIAGGFGVLIPVTRKAAGIGLIALLVAVFPANIYMAQHPELYCDIASATTLDIRLPLQAVLIAWVWWAVDFGRGA
ncbi:MAG TPA: MauE/DoxX family redox-associated membrane protein [Candidatus Tumulicola sp.]